VTKRVRLRVRKMRLPHADRSKHAATECARRRRRTLVEQAALNRNAERRGTGQRCTRAYRSHHMSFMQERGRWKMCERSARRAAALLSAPNSGDVRVRGVANRRRSRARCAPCPLSTMTRSLSTSASSISCVITIVSDGRTDNGEQVFLHCYARERIERSERLVEQQQARRRRARARCRRAAPSARKLARRASAKREPDPLDGGIDRRPRSRCKTSQMPNSTFLRTVSHASGAALGTPHRYRNAPPRRSPSMKTLPEWKSPIPQGAQERRLARSARPMIPMTRSSRSQVERPSARMRHTT